MPIAFDASSRVFHLSTSATSYVFYVDENSRFFHLYYGAAIKDGAELIAQQPVFNPASFSPVTEGEESSRTPDHRLQEFSGFNTGDYRHAAVKLRTSDGAAAASMYYVKHRIIPGKPRLEELPSAFGDSPDAETLELTLADPAANCEIVLCYTVFPACDVIVRSASARNTGSAPLTVECLSSAQLDFDRCDFDVVHLCGSWARERHAQRNRLHFGAQQIRSNRGASGHPHNPAVALCAPEATEEQGSVYGLVLAYSADFCIDIEVAQYNTARLTAGINPETFSWVLQPGESFQAPEAYLTFSAAGFGQMSRNFHDFMRAHLLSPRWSLQKRPILINNWEATYFNFNAEKILAIAKSGAELGIEMLVLDDGWFGQRNDDQTSLGDWFVNTAKIGDLAALVKDINALGMKFGLWFEPEMISEKSELYRTHPDWVMHIPGRKRSLGRNQLLLDMSRPEVVDYMFETISKVLRSANIEYVKWDMNRNHAEVFSAALSPSQQGEVPHRFILGVYRLYRMLLAEFPDLLIEGCSGGGGRFDAGILAYSPQIWCSDDSDAMERLAIQGGTSLFYPASAMGAHVSVCPNHMTWRNTPFTTRGYVAFAGTFGYELDLTKLSQDDCGCVREQVALYHRWHELVNCGDYYRLTPAVPAAGEEQILTAWSFVAKDRKQAVVTAVRQKTEVHTPAPKICLRGLDPAQVYNVVCGDKKTALHGDILMTSGLLLSELPHCEGSAVFITLEAC